MDKPCPGGFQEFLEVVSRVGRGSLQDKLSWVFSLYDADGDGRISRAELAAVVAAVYDLLGHSARPPASQQAALDHTHRIFHVSRCFHKNHDALWVFYKCRNAL